MKKQIIKRKPVKTRRLILRALKASDYKVWFDAYVNGLPPKNKWDRAPMKKSRCSKNIFKKIMKEHEQIANADDYYRYHIYDKKTNELIGLIDFDVFVRSSHQFANFGYQIFNRHWGQGYGQEAVKAGLKIGFQQLKLNRLEAAINLDNKKSVRLAKAIGMKKEGIKKRYWFEHGEWVDHIIYVANPEDIGLKARKPF